MNRQEPTRTRCQRRHLANVERLLKQYEAEAVGGDPDILAHVEELRWELADAEAAGCPDCAGTGFVEVGWGRMFDPREVPCGSCSDWP